MRQPLLLAQADGVADRFVVFAQARQRLLGGALAPARAAASFGTMSFLSSTCKPGLSYNFV